MATVNVGSLHSDSHTLSVFQTGQNFCDVSLRNDLLNSDSSEWLCAVESLQIPLDGTRYFDNQKTELFNIRRLQNNQQFRDPLTHLYQENALVDAITEILPGDPASIRAYTVDTVGRVRTDRFEVRSIGDFVEMLIQWYQRFNQLMRTQPLVPKADGTRAFNQDWDQHLATREMVDALGNVITQDDGTGNQVPRLAADDVKRKFEHLRVRVSASGNLSFIFSSLFASLFYIECSEYAQEIFGLPAIISYDMADPNNIVLRDIVHDGVPVGGTPGTMTSPINTWNVDDDDWMVTLSCSGTNSVFSAIDSRLAVALSTDLPLKRSLIIVDEAEEFSSILHESPLDNEFEITNIISDQFHSEFHCTGRSRAGQYMVKRPNDPVVEWVSLGSDINVRTLRLRLSIRERIFVSPGRWKIITSPLPVESHTGWSCKLLFAKRIH